MKAAKKLNVPPCADCESREDSIFCILSHPELENMTRFRTHNMYKKGQVVFYEGNLPQGLYCIFSGKVKIHKLGEDGKEQIVRLARRGNILGYRALLCNDTYHASATALEDTVICHFPKHVYLDLIMNNPQFSFSTIRHLSVDLRVAEKMIMNMAQKHVRERIAETLLMLKEYYGLESDNVTINATLTRENIGNLAGTSTETSIRILSDLNHEKIIKLEGKKIRIVNMRELSRIANLND